MREAIGLIGVGLVGSALAENLLGAGFSVVGFDIDGDRLRWLEEAGGEPASSAREVGERTGRVFLSLMTAEIVRQAVEGPQGLMRAKSPPSHVIDCSTADPEETIALAGRLREKNVSYLDAPVSGSSEQIRKREGVFMVGGDPAAFEACRDLFDAVARRSCYVGLSGDGSKTKLASNLILGLNRAALAEGMVFAERLGLDLKTFLPLLKKTPAYSRAMDAKGRKFLEEDYAPVARLVQHAKDLDIILDHAGRRGQPLPLASVHKDLLDAAIRAGDGDLDNCAVIKEIRRMGS